MDMNQINYTDASARAPMTSLTRARVDA